jgi:hypothetical protein
MFYCNKKKKKKERKKRGNKTLKEQFCYNIFTSTTKMSI